MVQVSILERGRQHAPCVPEDFTAQSGLTIQLSVLGAPIALYPLAVARFVKQAHFVNPDHMKKLSAKLDTTAVLELKNVNLVLQVTNA